MVIEEPHARMSVCVPKYEKIMGKTRALARSGGDHRGDIVSKAIRGEHPIWQRESGQVKPAVDNGRWGEQTIVRVDQVCACDCSPIKSLRCIVVFSCRAAPVPCFGHGMTAETQFSRECCDPGPWKCVLPPSGMPY